MISVKPNLKNLSFVQIRVERYFSILKRVNHYLRSTMAQDRCLALAVLSIQA